MYREEFVRSVSRWRLDAIECDRHLIPPELQRFLPAGSFHKQAAHGFRCRAKKVGPVLPLVGCRPSQSQIGLVDQRRRLQILGILLPFQLTGRQAPQFVIDQRQQLVRGGGVSGCNAVEDGLYLSMASEF